ncbi:MAG TPA: hypothetical protein VGE93_16500, partial [Bryobacteraceae bacterium]
DPRLLSLTGQAINVAASTVLEQKIRVLGKLVADSVRDDAKVDESVMFLAALQDLEAPHVALLVEMGMVYTYINQAKPNKVEKGEAGNYANFRSYKDLQRDMTRYGITLRPALATLERHGLIEAEEIDFNQLFSEYDNQVQSRGQMTRFTNFHPDIPTLGWRITEFGIALRDYLEEQGNLAKQADAANDQPAKFTEGSSDANG